MRRPTRRLASTPSNLASIMPRAIVAGDSDDRDIDSTQRVLGYWHVGLSALHSRPATGRLRSLIGRRSLDCSEPTQPSGKDGSDRPRETAGHADGMGTLHSSYGLLDCSTAYGGLCHEASIQPVTRLNARQLPGPTDNFLGGSFLHW
jgi:hypothetical protein